MLTPGSAFLDSDVIQSEMTKGVIRNSGHARWQCYDEEKAGKDRGMGSPVAFAFRVN